MSLTEALQTSMAQKVPCPRALLSRLGYLAWGDPTERAGSTRYLPTGTTLLLSRASATEANLEVIPEINRMTVVTKREDTERRRHGVDAGYRVAIQPQHARLKSYELSNGFGNESRF